MMTDTTPRPLKIAVDRKAESGKRVPQARRKSIELTVTISNFNSEIMRPSCQYSTVFKFVKWRSTAEGISSEQLS